MNLNAEKDSTYACHSQKSLTSHVHPYNTGTDLRQVFTGHAVFYKGVPAAIYILALLMDV